MTIALLAILVCPASADEASDIIGAVDDSADRALDQIIQWDVVNQKPGSQKPETMRFTSTVKGTRTLTEFESPANLKGTRVLVVSRNQLYIFLPQYNKVRRIASHVTNQGFMGTTYSHNDISASHFGDVYAAKLLSRDGDRATLELTPREEADAPYAKAMMTVDTRIGHPLKITYFSDKGTEVKTETRTGYECRDEVCLPTVMRMEDHTRSGAWTELRRIDWQLNTGVSDDVFTTRNLQRGD
jgi:outer membrane lipoprotein-sorting protein